MRPHTRTQCTDGKECSECNRGKLAAAGGDASTQPGTAQGNTASGGTAPTGNGCTSTYASSTSSVSSSSSSTTSSSTISSGVGSLSSASSSGNSSLGYGSASKLSSNDHISPFVAPTSGPLRRSITSAAAAQQQQSSHLNNKTGSGSGIQGSALPNGSSASSTCFGGTGSDYGSSNRSILIVELPAEILVKILNYMSFKEIGQVRLVSRRFNEICASMLNSTFQKLQSLMLSRFQAIKSQMPRRESARRNHPLARESDIVETLHMRLTLLQMTFGKHIERKHVCFFAGEILDEVQRIMQYIRQTPCLATDYKITDELFDLSTMAMEYFKEHIEPTLPEISYFGAEFLDFTTPFATPTKRRSQSGSNGLLGVDSPSSSRASVASSCSDPWSSSSVSGTLNDDFTTHGNLSSAGSTMGTDPDGLPQSNMVLRKRIRRIRQGMKRYNNQLVEVKKELKTCKTKMETQTKQVQEYSQRLEEYDKKFEESSRKFQTLLTELNKCKTELQYWRSKSTTLLSLPPPTCAQCDAPLANEYEDLKGLGNQPVGIGASLSGFSDSEHPDSLDDIDNEVQIKTVSGSPSPSASPKSGSHGHNGMGMVTAVKSGPPSPFAAATAYVGRKRRSRDDVAAALNDEDQPTTSSGLRKSLRGAGVKSTRGKRPKTSSAN